MGDAVRWGILGAAKIAREWVCPGIHASRQGRVAAVASRERVRAVGLAEPYDARVVDGYAALLADPEIDAVYIGLPNSAHVEWTERALAAGKAVLCEKPIALRAGEIDRLIEVRDRSHKLAAEAFMVVHHPQWRRVQEMVEEGAIGRLVQVQGAFSFYNDDPGNIRNQAALGGGALRDIGVYPCVATRFVSGAEPEAIEAASIDWERGIDAAARVMARFPGFALDFYVSMRLAARQEMVFHGDKGWIAVRCPFNAGFYADPVVELRTADGMRRLERFPRAEQYREQIDAFNGSVLEGVPYACPLEFSRGNQAMIDMIYAKAGPAPG
jgi:predicted dehydrogenase